MVVFAFLNVFLRSPQFLFGDKQGVRKSYVLRSIFRRCPNVDFIGLCEVFKGYESFIRTEAWSRYRFLSISDPYYGLLQNSGLMLLYDDSKFVLVESVFEYFKDAYLLDNFARKGFLYASFINRETNTKMHVIVTHLNDCFDGNDSARIVQYKQLLQIKSYVSSNIPADHPYVLLGDFNLDLRTNTYYPLTSLFKSLGIITNALTPTYMGHMGCICTRQSIQNVARVYDHIIVSNNQCVSSYRIYNQHFEGVPVSDHVLLSCTTGVYSLSNTIRLKTGVCSATDAR